ncbi:hypothetical protein HDV02_002123 [Globomyces sp. JEL0801]|nr:hypothetical protein HDV02_002123 [Globomyces sp. JEL0801]
MSIKSIRSFAELAYHRTTTPSFTPHSVSGIHSIQPTASSISSEQPSFAVVNQGSGSLLSVRLHKGLSLSARVGSLLASSGKIDTQLKRHHSFTRGLIQKLAGGSIFVEEEHDSVVLLTPNVEGDIAVITMDGTRDIIFRSPSYLASTNTLDFLVSPQGFGLKDGGFFHTQARGQGILSLSSYGGMTALQLKPGEECIVQPQYVIGWDSSMKTEPVVTDALPAAQRAVRKSLAWLSKYRIPAFLQRQIESFLFFIAKYARLTVHQFRYWVLGERGVYRITGPGEVFLSTRLKPSLFRSVFSSTNK